MIEKIRSWWRKFFNANVRRGRKGEIEARRFLKKSGYKILAKNWTSGRYELDIVAVKDGCLVFVEVRGRSQNSLQNGYYSVSHKKKDALKKAIKGFFKHYRNIMTYRFDIISIDWDNNKIVAINHYENVSLR